MRRFLLAAGALIAAAGIGSYFALAGGGASTGRVQRGSRYGGRAWPQVTSGCAPASGAAFGSDWSSFGADKTVTLNDLLSPSCAVDATRIQFTDATGTHGTFWSPGVICTVGTGAKAHPQVWVRGKTSSGVMNLGTLTSSGVYDFGNCNFTATFALCTYTTTTNMSAGDGAGVGSVGTIVMGLMGVLPNAGSGTGQTAAIDVEVWGVACP